MNTPNSNARVLIVESLAPRDLLNGYREARATADVLTSLEVKNLMMEVRSSAEFDAACGVFASGEFDALHLACHACANHLVLTDGTEIPWNTFARKLGPGIHGKHLMMSMCHGGCPNIPATFSACPNRPAAIVGPTQAVDWSRLVVAWQVYYANALPADGCEPDEPCEAVSRAHMASGASLICHQWSGADGRYRRFESCPECAVPVFSKTYPGMDAVLIFDLAERHAPELIKRSASVGPGQA